MSCKYLVYTLVSIIFIHIPNCYTLTDEARSKGFVYLHEIDPTIRTSVRYHSAENFVGTPVNGYKKPVIIMTRQAAEALQKVQVSVKKDGYSLVIYDAYRPQQAVNHFIQWSAESHNQTKKSHYYPRVNKADVFMLGYVAQRSGHSRGSTVDLTIIEDNKNIHAISEQRRVLRDGFTITILDDGTVDMGSSFDLLDVASHTESNLVDEKYKALRIYFKQLMEQYGFKNYSQEWWHFTLQNEPFPADQDSSYHDFLVE